MRVLVVCVVGLAAGCQAAQSTLVTVATFTGGVGAGAVTTRERGNAMFSIGGGAHAGQRELASGETDRSAGLSVYSEGVGIASDNDLGFAAHSRLQIGAFGDDYFFGEIDYEFGPGFLRHAAYGVGLVAGWNFSGQFDGTHSLPVRAIGYWSRGDLVVQGSAHISYRGDSDSWSGRGAELGLAMPSFAIGVRYEDQNGADVISLTAGWALTVMKRR